MLFPEVRERAFLNLQRLDLPEQIQLPRAVKPFGRATYMSSRFRSDDDDFLRGRFPLDLHRLGNKRSHRFRYLRNPRPGIFPLMRLTLRIHSRAEQPFLQLVQRTREPVKREIIPKSVLHSH